MATEVKEPVQAGSTRPNQRRRAFLPLGKLFSLFAAVLLFIGVYKGVNLLALMGYFFLFALFLNALLADRRLKQIALHRFFPDPLHEGVIGGFMIEAHNLGQATSPAWFLIDPAGKNHQGWGIPSLAKGGRFRIQGRLTPEARGWWHLSPLEKCGSFPFGLVQVRLHQKQEDAVLVLPRLGISRHGALEKFLSPLVHLDDTGKVGRFHPAAQEEFHGLRNFRPGDSTRGIHWRTSARRGELMVREYEDYPGDDLLVVVDPGMGQGKDLEDLVSFAATILHDACRVRGNKLMLALLCAESVIIEDIAHPQLGVKMLEALAPLRGFVTRQSYQTAMGQLQGLLANRKLPPSRVLLERTDKPSEFSLGKGHGLPVLNPKVARERGFYEPPVKVTEGVS